jgi:hypothetical protein
VTLERYGQDEGSPAVGVGGRLRGVAERAK